MYPSIGLHIINLVNCFDIRSRRVEEVMLLCGSENR